MKCTENGIFADPDLLNGCYYLCEWSDAYQLWFRTAFRCPKVGGDQWVYNEVTGECEAPPDSPSPSPEPLLGGSIDDEDGYGPLVDFLE